MDLSRAFIQEQGKVHKIFGLFRKSPVIFITLCGGFLSFIGTPSGFLLGYRRVDIEPK